MKDYSNCCMIMECWFNIQTSKKKKLLQLDAIKIMDELYALNEWHTYMLPAAVNPLYLANLAFLT